jgi:hypothetical protein
MHQDNTLDLSSLASFERLEQLLIARRRDDSTESRMTFEAFEVELGHARPRPGKRTQSGGPGALRCRRRSRDRERSGVESAKYVRHEAHR